MAIGGSLTMEAVMEAPADWAALLSWHKNLFLAGGAPPPVPTVAGCAPFAESAAALRATVTAARRAIAAAAELRSCPMGWLPKYRKQLRHLEPVFAAAGAQRSGAPTKEQPRVGLGFARSCPLLRRWGPALPRWEQAWRWPRRS